ncbi:WLM domain-containing protein [Dactylonectria macrodidyma]|uniref:WLM domain-containing protein n=1 Tax=Dactylonectria macrodidyma TaxID=307937 RepID=A0A9P9J9Y4_9HYPO|nr:WLM domain-containing protein [Dactylonectria macrodidyma]
MAAEKDRWSSNEYQNVASFVPKLAGKVVQWLDLQKDDVLIDIGCGDGILNAEFANILAQGNGSQLGIDSSASMIDSARELCKDAKNSTFETLDATQLVNKPELQKGTFTKAFSNAAMHWILRPEATRADFFKGVYASLAPGGTFAFEMGGQSNVSEMRGAVLMAVARRIGMPAALAADPWFFPDEAWITARLEEVGFVVEKAEREWRPTKADKGGVEGWVRLFAKQLLDAVPDEEREEAIKECAEVLKHPTSNRFLAIVVIKSPHVIVSKTTSLNLLNMADRDALVLSYVHLAKFPRASEALHTLKKVASMVKPIIRARNWKVGELAEFFPDQANLLGLNVDRGRKICLRLRHAGDRSQFLPIESIVDTMLHELAHIVQGPHDAKFHALWDQLRDEHQGLLLKGYTGEGFLSEGRRLGGVRMLPQEARRLAREAAEKRRVQPTGTGGGKRLGGAAPRPGDDIRRIIADAAQRRNQTLKGCATDKLSDSQIRSIADTATRNGFRTQAEEDEANEAAIATALWELVQEDESAKYGSSYIPPTAANPTGNGGGTVMVREGGIGVGGGSSVGSRGSHTASGFDGTDTTEDWACNTCTLLNPANFLSCDACGTQRSALLFRKSEAGSSKLPDTSRSQTVIDLTQSPPRKQRPVEAPRTEPPKPPPTWQCSFCGTEMARQWWTCSTCGKMKDNSR